MDYAENPEKYLDQWGKERLGHVSHTLWRKLKEILEENVEARLQHMVMCLSDNFGDGPVTVDDLQGDLLATSENPF